MSKRTEHLKKIFAGRNLDADAAALKVTKVLLETWVSDQYNKEQAPIPPAIAVAIGKLTDTNPRLILDAQTDDALEAAGVASNREPKSTEVKVQTAPVKEPKAKKGKKVKDSSVGSRGAFGPRSTFTLD